MVIQVEFLRPEKNPDEWMNILVLHQNRADNRGTDNFITESMLPDFLDIVVWGHEHECRINPEWVPEREFYITQPGKKDHN